MKINWENKQSRLQQAVIVAKEKRNQLLKDSDWTRIDDVPLTDETKKRWADYRQALRDLPEIDGWPNVDFPDPPETV